MAAMLVMLIVGCLAFTSVSVAYADDAYVLPTGRTSVAVENKFFIPIEDRFGPNGKARRRWCRRARF